MSQGHPQSSVYHRSIMYTPLVAAVLGAGYYAYKFNAQEDLEDDDQSASKSEKAPAPRHDRSDRHLVGLHNLGNTCYMNSLIQALSGCPSYLKYIESVFNQGLLNGKDEQNLEIINQFILIVMQVYHHDQDSDPRELYRVLC